MMIIRGRAWGRLSYEGEVPVSRDHVMLTSSVKTYAKRESIRWIWVLSSSLMSIYHHRWSLASRSSSVSASPLCVSSKHSPLQSQHLTSATLRWQNPASLSFSDSVSRLCLTVSVRRMCLVSHWSAIPPLSFCHVHVHEVAQSCIQ